jgi:hypothetical protein
MGIRIIEKLKKLISITNLLCRKADVFIVKLSDPEIALQDLLQNHQ